MKFCFDKINLNAAFCQMDHTVFFRLPIELEIKKYVIYIHIHIYEYKTFCNNVLNICKDCITLENAYK